MTSNMRVVVDTNVLVSAVLLPRSMPRRALDRKLEHGSLHISIATVAELNDVLRRPRFNPETSGPLPFASSTRSILS
jgi:predicted nucleic acid-binding protein